MTTTYTNCGHSVEPEIAALVCPVCQQLALEKVWDEVDEHRETLSIIQEMICEEYGTIEYNLMRGCMCMMCNEYQFRNLDGEIEARGDTLEELTRNWKNERTRK